MLIGIVSAMSSFGDRVKEARVALGLKQEALAALVGVEQAQVSRIERGERGGDSMHARDLFKLAAALRVRPQWLLDGLGRREPFDESPPTDVTIGTFLLKWDAPDYKGLRDAVLADPMRWRLATVARAVTVQAYSNFGNQEPHLGWAGLLDSLETGQKTIGGARELAARSVKPAGLPKKSAAKKRA